jgi:predicted RNA binding protein YcfA (HicA-like mRNA interferase family)
MIWTLSFRAATSPLTFARSARALPVAPLQLSVYDTHMKSGDLIKLLERDGWTLRGVKGSHHMFTHPQKPGHVAVPHPKKDLGTGLVASILKQAGLKGAKP